jgi:ketosteroid isomerase-like protein
MGKHKNTVLQAIYGAFLRGDVPAILDKLSDNIEWVGGPPNDAIPTSGTYKGKSSVQQFFQKVADNFDIRVFDPNEYVSQYDKVIAFVHVELVAKSRQAGEPGCGYGLDRSGRKVTKFREYEDTGSVMTALAGG